jgi:hypothetical protein
MSFELWLALRFAHPGIVGATVAALVLGSFLLVRWVSEAPLTIASDEAGFALEPSAWTGIAISLLFGYMFFGSGFIYQRQSDELLRIGEGDEEPAEDAFRALRRSRWVAAIGAVLGLLLVLRAPGSYGFRFSLADADYFWFLLAIPSLTGMLARAVYYSLRPNEMLDRIRARDVDLLDLEPVRMFGRLGMNGALSWFVGTSIGSLLLLGFGGTLQLLPLLLATAGMGALGLFLSVRGLAARIRDAKRVELLRVNAELHEARDATLARDPAERGHLADLLAWRNHVESISESPIDTSSFLRFALYLLIPLGSWSASAIVERIINSLLG